MLKKMLLIVVLLISSKALLADCSSISCSDVYVDLIYVKTSGTVFIGTSGDEANLTCGAVEGVYFTLSQSQAGANMTFSTLLTAQTTGKQVLIKAVDTPDSGCVIKYVKLAR